MSILVSDLDQPLCHPWLHDPWLRHTHASSDEYGQLCELQAAAEAPRLVAVVAALRKGYALDYTWTQVDRGPAKDAASYYLQAGESGGSRRAAGGARAQGLSA